MIKFPDLTAEDIEVRVDRVSANKANTGVGLNLLLYKDARVDMKLLDEVVGQENWQRKHFKLDGTTFCSVGILCNINTPNGDDMEWVWKTDCGSPSNFESEKGAASDAFKRACFNWCIGRELYTCPELFIWQPNETTDPFFTVAYKQDGKPTTYDKFECAKILIEDKKIVAVAIRNTSTGKMWSIDTRS